MAVTVTEWLGATNKFKQNISSTTSSAATSLGTGNNGPNGMDIAYPIQLSSTRWLWLFGDNFWPTAAGQTRFQGRIITNAVALQVGADLSTSTLTFYCGPRPGTTALSNSDPWPFFEHTAPRLVPNDFAHGTFGSFKYPMAGIRLASDCVLVVGMLHVSNVNFAPGTTGWQGVGGAAGTTPVGPWAELLWSTALDSTTPDTWAHQEVEVDLPRSAAAIGLRTGFHMGPGLDIVGDHLVVWMNGPWDQTGHWSVARYPLDEVLQGIMRAPEWWAGGERWVPDRPNAQRRVRVSPGRLRSEQGGAVFKRPDGRYQLLTVPEPLYDPFLDPADRKQGLAHISYGIASEPGAVFDTLNDIYEIPVVLDDFDFRYGAYMATGQTWAGKASVNDQVQVYSTHNSNGLVAFFDSRTYFPRILQVTGI